MLTRHLYAYADSVDETRYIITFRDDRSKLANSEFAEMEEDIDETAQAYWDAYYRSRLGELDLRIGPDTRVLDCACGIGRLGTAIRKMASPGLVVFCDLSLDQLQARAAAPQTASQLADVCVLPFADASFDVVIGNSFLHHLSDVPAAIREMYRVCRPGGVVAVLHEPSIYAPFWERLPVSLYKSLYKHTDTSNFTDLWYFRRNNLRKILDQAGFTDVRINARGVLGAAATTSYLNVLRKLRVRTSWMRTPADRLRVLLDHLELVLTRGRGLPTAPSLSVVARKGAAAP